MAFDEEDEKLKSLDSVQMALVELYAYEMQSVDAIERMTDVDSSYIGSWIAQIKFILSGEAVALENTADEAKTAVANDNISNEIYEDTYENSDDDNEQYDESDDESEEYSNEYDEQEAVSSVYQKRNRHHENAVTLFIRRLFPALSLPARMAMSWIAGCIVVIALVSVLFVSVIAGKNNKKKLIKIMITVTCSIIQQNSQQQSRQVQQLAALLRDRQKKEIRQKTILHRLKEERIHGKKHRERLQEITKNQENIRKKAL